MAILKIPLRNDLPSYKFQIELESKIYFFDVSYYERSNLWYFDILDENENPIIVGIPILIGRNLLESYVDERLPPGQFAAINESGTADEATRETLNVDVNLYYNESVT